KKRQRSNLPKPVTAILKTWLTEHKEHPYPNEDEKIALVKKTGLARNQISNWFINARRRILRPMLA
ncbi:Homeodomain-like protein, partial [Zychaea mexicana]|uniref:Homeodomain-like protein n=1 Tax=Zychaea mexicana TaxID=64656 RepID=UPI0022FEF8D0